MTRAGFATNELLGRLALIALLFVAVIPTLHAGRDALAAHPPVSGWQVVVAVGRGLAQGVVPLVAGFFLLGFTVSRVLMFRPGTRVRVVSGPSAGAEGTVAEDHNPNHLVWVHVLIREDGTVRREKLHADDLRKWWMPGWL